MARGAAGHAWSPARDPVALGGVPIAPFRPWGNRRLAAAAGILCADRYPYKYNCALLRKPLVAEADDAGPTLGTRYHDQTGPIAMPKRPSAASRTKTPRSKPTIIGFLDRIEDATLAGWAFDPTDPNRPLTMQVRIDGTVIDMITCDGNRPDVAAFNLPTVQLGFEYRIPGRFQDGMRHVVSFATADGAKVELPGRGGVILSELHFCLERRTRLEAVLDGLVDGLIQGWALRIGEATGEKTGGATIMVSTRGQPIAEFVADQFRADVAEALGADPACGFSFALPPELCTGKSVVLDFHVLPERTPLRGSPLQIAVPSSGERARISSLIEQADELFRYAYRLRRELKAALPAERPSLADYPGWARRNQPLIAARYGDIEGRPLVSVICPVFRPDLREFAEAVGSVQAQSYENWELILVDDASHDSRLAEFLEQAAARDSRIRLQVESRNGGIATATNRALKLARGEVVAFFDHDDLLDPNALEVMLRARSATGARLLYSDEDKVDGLGRFSEPNLKPDFNYRFLLDLNYICHLVMADTALLREAGGLDPRFDGAQDHDLLLRLAKRVGPHEVHHVAEILYHWRISARSTAGGASAKPKAAGAGEAAVAAHLKRRNIAGHVQRRGALTCYSSRFEFSDNPGVSILIPFRNHVGLTRACVEAIRRHTRRLDYEIILIDNWSDDPAVQDFCTTQGNMADTKIVRVAEPFNFSRINNIGAAAATRPFLLFLNNDVIIDDPHWLRTLLDEALADPAVGAVGPKLLYPNGTVQHAGVVLGVGGIADHAFRGLPADAPGYIAHAIAAREVSALTAACMLVRREAFEAVGGFDEAELAVAFNDVDLCVKLRQAGWRLIFTPDLVCEHRESMSRGDDFGEDKLARFMRENEAMRARWETILPEDPFYNRHFAREGGVYRDLRRIEPEDERRIERPQPVEAAIAPVLPPRRAPKADTGTAKPVSSQDTARRRPARRNTATPRRKTAGGAPARTRETEPAD